MKKFLKIVTWICTSILLLTILFFLSKYKVWEIKKPKICCNNKCFILEIANTPELRQLWLMHREYLPEENWMLFIFDKMWIHSFWMKNTLIPLAWIRLNSDLEIVDIKLMEPCKTQECQTYTPEKEAQYVLEINQDRIKRKWLFSIWEKCTLK